MTDAEANAPVSCDLAVALMDVLASVPTGVALLDADQRVVWTNLALRAMLRREAMELQGARFSDLVARDESGAHEIDLGVGARQGGHRECGFRRKDGTVLWGRLSVTPIRASTVDGAFSVAFVEDATHRRELETQLRQAQKMSALGCLAGAITHDFNNVLAVIVGYSKLLLETSALEESVRRRLEVIHAAGEQAAVLTGQLLAFSRKEGLSPRVFDLNKVISRLVPMLRCLVGEDVEFITRLEADLGTVRADPGQIEQVVVNLVVNAREALARGGTIAIETRDVTLEGGRYTMLEVSDTGCGMDAETRARIFEQFFTTKEEGSGLGLTTVSTIVEQNMGSIRLQSEPGVGTTFRIYLPHAVETAAVEARGKVADPALGTETILLTEDEAMVREYVRDVLELQGYTVLLAERSEEALRISGRHVGPIHLLVTDVVMPGMSGRELSERMAVMRPEVRVLFMSGYTDDAIERNGVCNTGTAFLQKPFAPEVLARKVRDVLNQE